MRLQEEGKLVVNFKTEPRFRGQFVLEHPGIVNAIIISNSIFECLIY